MLDRIAVISGVHGHVTAAYLKAGQGLTLFNVGGTGNHLDAPPAPFTSSWRASSAHQSQRRSR